MPRRKPARLRAFFANGSTGWASHSTRSTPKCSAANRPTCRKWCSESLSAHTTKRPLSGSPKNSLRWPSMDRRSSRASAPAVRKSKRLSHIGPRSFPNRWCVRMYTKILYSLDAGVARITLNRPDKRNALSRELIDEVKSAIGDAGRDPECRVVLLAGAGKDFCSGADLAGLEKTAKNGVLDNMADARNMAELFLAIRNHRCPVIAAVQGRALAGGCGLATACDIVLASESAQFGYPEVNIGFVAAMVMAILRRSVSEKAAFELVATGQVISASRAQELGMAHRVFSDGEFEVESTGYVNRLATKSQSAVMLSKRLLYQMDMMSFEAALEAGVQTNAIARMTEDCRRGVERFLKKSTVS